MAASASNKSNAVLPNEPISPEMASSLTDIPTSAEAPMAKPEMDPREKRFNAITGIDGHLLNDDVGAELKPEEAVQFREQYKVNPKETYDKVMEIGKSRLIPRVVGGPMSPDEWEAMHQFQVSKSIENAKAAAQSAGLPIDAKALSDAAAQAEESFQRTAGKHQKYIVQAPKAPVHDLVDDAPPLVAPKQLRASPKASSGNQFAQSLIDMVRGVNEVAGKQAKTGKNYDDLFAKVLKDAK